MAQLALISTANGRYKNSVSSESVLQNPAIFREGDDGLVCFPTEIKRQEEDYLFFRSIILRHRQTILLRSES